MSEPAIRFDSHAISSRPVCGELLIFDTNQQFATHRPALLEQNADIAPPVGRALFVCGKDGRFDSSSLIRQIVTKKRKKRLGFPSRFKIGAGSGGCPAVRAHVFEGGAVGAYAAGSGASLAGTVLEDALCARAREMAAGEVVWPTASIRASAPGSTPYVGRDGQDPVSVPPRHSSKY
jgi:hypothetical protein